MSSTSETTDVQTSKALQVITGSLPRGTTTLDIYNNLKRFGSISKIIIRQSRMAYGSERAEIIFKPAPVNGPWFGNGVMSFRLSNDVLQYVNIRVSDARWQPKPFIVESPTGNGVIYGEEIIVTARVMDFGILKSQNVFSILASRSDDRGQSIQLILNLKHFEITVRFPQTSNVSYSGAYRFTVALDDKFKISRIKNCKVAMAYLLELETPPRFSGFLGRDIAQTHLPEAKSWLADDIWVRQTDIVAREEDAKTINRTPIAIRKNLNIINLARWNIVRLELKDNPQTLAAQQLLEAALRDFNINVNMKDNFECSASSMGIEAQAWGLLGDIHVQETDQTDSLLRDLRETFNLSFPLRYQLSVCISQGWLSEYNIDTVFLQQLTALPENKAIERLIHVDTFMEKVLHPTDIFQEVKYSRPLKPPRIPEYCFEAYHATVTASGLLFFTPSIEMTNRIVRKYKSHADRFLRVRFEDDIYRGQTRVRSGRYNKSNLLLSRIKRVMTHGIKLGDRHYEFLAWGNSQLREHGTYFFARIPGGLNAQKIRAEMGAFDGEKVVAKRAARMGQCFSTTRATQMRIRPIIKANALADVENVKYSFTDGVGKISKLAAKLVHNHLNINGPIPSVYQFRLGGCKGVLAVDPDLPGLDINVRHSQFKFFSSSGELEIIRYSQFWQSSVSRQLIVVLSDLGVSDQVFLKKQEETIQALDNALLDDKIALKALRNNVDPNGMIFEICDLVSHGFRKHNEPFVMSLLFLWRAWSLKYLKEKAKIPITCGALVLGCVDETSTLRGHFESLTLPESASQEDKLRSLPEIFVQITNPQNGRREIIEQTCIVTRNPALHRGDVRVVRAINIPSLHHICDAVVFPQTGDRDLGSMCSGGDLDGDDYLVIWDQELIPQVWNAEPFHYDAPPPKTALGEITTSDIINFFYDYLQNDSVGIIAHAHLGAADYFEDGIQSEQCLELVQLHSMAVDYPKTGVPARMQPRLDPDRWPHFMEKRSRSYKSTKILGQLYDAVERVSFVPCWDGLFDARILSHPSPPHELIEKAAEIKHQYDAALSRIMAQHRVKTEFEVWSTFVLSHSKAAKDFKFHEEIGQISKALREQYHATIVEHVGGTEFSQLAPFAVAAYLVTKAQVDLALREVSQELRAKDITGMPFITFPWILQSVLCKIASDAEQSCTYITGSPLLDLGKTDEGNSTNEDNAAKKAQDRSKPTSCNSENDPLIDIETHGQNYNCHSGLTYRSDTRVPDIDVSSKATLDEANQLFQTNNVILAKNTLKDPLTFTKEQLVQLELEHGLD